VLLKDAGVQAEISVHWRSSAVSSSILFWQKQGENWFPATAPLTPPGPLLESLCVLRSFFRRNQQLDREPFLDWTFDLWLKH
jgi:hypothetical protein